MVKVDIDTVFEGYPLDTRIKQIKDKSLRYVSIDLLGNLKRYSPVDHGRLQGSWWRHRSSEDSWEIQSSAKYAVYVNEGTGLYGPTHSLIKPKKGKVLRFEVGGKTIFSRWSKGIKPRRFVQKSIKQTENRVSNLVIRSCIEVDTGG